MEENLELLLIDLVRPLSSASGRVEVVYNSTSFYPSVTKNRSAPLSGSESLNYLIHCKARSHQAVVRLANQVKDVVAGTIPESVHPLLTVLVVREMSASGVDPDGLHQITLSVNTDVPIVRSIKIC